MIGYAIFSECQRYRYGLSRVAYPEKKTLMYVLLNPSTADAQKNDPTVARCWVRARNLGYGQMLIGNLFAIRSADPRDIFKESDPVGPDNDTYLVIMAAAAHTIILGWGNEGAYRGRSKQVVKLLRENYARPLYCLHMNGSGMPKHPLYLRYDLPLIEFKE